MGSEGFYKGEIVSVNSRNRTFHIRFEDGGVDRAVPSTNLRTVPQEELRSGEILAEVLRSNQTLQSVDLAGNQLQRTAISLADGLSGNSSLVTLSLRDNQLDRVAVQALAVGLLNHPSLQQLDLSHNQIGARGAEVLGNVLLGPGPVTVTGGSGNGERRFAHSKLTALNLSWNDIKTAGAVVVLHSLALAAARSARKGATAAIGAFAGAASLTSLDLSSNGLDDDHMPTTGKHSLCGLWEPPEVPHAATAPGGSAFVDSSETGENGVDDDDDDEAADEMDGGGFGGGGPETDEADHNLGQSWRHRERDRADDYGRTYFGRYAWPSPKNPEEHSYRARVPEMLLGLLRQPHCQLRRLELGRNSLGEGTELQSIKKRWKKRALPLPPVVGASEGAAEGGEGGGGGGGGGAAGQAEAADEKAGLFADSGSGSCVCERTAEALAMGLRHNRSLRRLGVGFNPLGMEGTLKLVRALKRSSNTALVSMGVENTVLESDGTLDPHRHHTSMTPIEVLSYFMNKHEVHMRLADFFGALDINKDGRVTRAELEEGITKVFAGKANASLQPADFDELHEIFDADGDGVVDLKEWCDEHVHGYESEGVVRSGEGGGGVTDGEAARGVLVIGGEHAGKMGTLTAEAMQKLNLKPGEPLEAETAYSVVLEGAQPQEGQETEGNKAGAEAEAPTGEGGAVEIEGKLLELALVKKDMGMTLRPSMNQINAYYKAHKHGGTNEFPYPHSTKGGHYPPAMIPMATCPGGVYCTVDPQEAAKAMIDREANGDDDDDESSDDEDDADDGEEGGEGEDEEDEEEDEEEARLTKLRARAARHCANQTWTVWGTARWGLESRFRAGHATCGPAMVGATIARVLAGRGVPAAVEFEFPHRERVLTTEPVHSCMTQLYQPPLTSEAAGADVAMTPEARREQQRRAWKAEESIFQSRLLESESGTLVDTAEMLDDAFEADWALTSANVAKIDEMEAFAFASGNAKDVKERIHVEEERIHACLREHYPKLRQVFRHFCGWHRSWANEHLAATARGLKAAVRASHLTGGRRRSATSPAPLAVIATGEGEVEGEGQEPGDTMRRRRDSVVVDSTRDFLVNNAFVVSFDTFLLFATRLGVMESGHAHKVGAGASAVASADARRLSAMSAAEESSSRLTRKQSRLMSVDGGTGVTRDTLQEIFMDANEDPFLLESNAADSLERHEFMEACTRLAMARYCRQPGDHGEDDEEEKGDEDDEGEGAGDNTTSTEANVGAGAAEGGANGGTAGQQQQQQAPSSPRRAKAGGQEFLSPSAAVERFMTVLLPTVWTEDLNPNKFREGHLYTLEVAEIFEDKLAPLNKLFADYAEPLDDEGEEQMHEFGAQLVMNVTEYFEMVIQTKMLSTYRKGAGKKGAGTGPLGRHEALRAFLMSNLTVEDEMESAEYKRLSFIDFLECLGRLAMTKYGGEEGMSSGKSSKGHDGSAFPLHLRRFLFEILPKQAPRRLSRKFSVSSGLMRSPSRASRRISAKYAGGAKAAKAAKQAKQAAAKAEKAAPRA